MYHLRLLNSILIVFVLIFYLPDPLEAHEGSIEDLLEMDLTELVNIKVHAATKTDISQLEAPQSITVITREEIEHSGAKNIGELLRGYVGANVVRIHSSQNMISVRGSNIFTPSKTLLLIDGHPIDTTTFSTTWWDLVPVSLYDIERIEFIRSPGTIYGLNAQNGVINILTHDPEDADEGDHFHTAISGGEQNYRKGYAGVFKKTDDLSYRFSVQAQQLNAFRTGKVKEIIRGMPSCRGEEGFDDSKDELMLDTLNFSGGLQTDLNGNPLHLSMGRRDIKKIKGRVPDRLCFNELEGHVEFVNVGYEFNTGDVNQNLTFSFNENEFGFLRNEAADTLANATMTFRKWGITYEMKTTWHKDHKLLMGGNCIFESGTNKSGVKFFSKEVKDEKIRSVYFQDEWRVTGKDKIYLGGRYSHHYIVGSSFAPMAAYVHNINHRNVFRLATYTSHRNPNLFESSMDYDQTTGFVDKRSTIVSNPDLDHPSTTTSYEIGFRSQPIDRLFFSVDVYRNNVTHGVEWDLVGTSGTGADQRPKYQSKHSLAQRVYGVEASLRYVLNNDWDLVNNVTLTSIENHSSDPDYKGDPSLNMFRGPNNLGEGRYGEEYFPPFIYNLLVNYNRSRFHGRFHYQYTAEHTWEWPKWSSTTLTETLNVKPVPSYSLVNAYLGYNFSENGTISLEGENIFNVEHTEWRGDTSYFGRMIWTSVIYEF